MARKVYGALDISDNELLNLRLQMLPSDPSALEAKAYYNTTAHEVRYHDGTTWKAVAVAGAPTGAAGGDLAGTYPNPTIRPDVIVDADVNSAANIAQSKIAGLTASLAAKQDTAGKGAANGYAPLDASSLIPTAHLPPLAVNDVFTVASEAAMLALTAQAGDMAIRTDTGKTYVLSASPASTLANWKEIMATGQVVSVNGQTGVVSITAASLSAVPTSRLVTAGNGLTGGGALSADVTLNVVGDATLNVAADQVSVVSAPKWTTARTISLTGDVTGSASVDGTANVSIATSGGGKRYAAALTASASQVVTHNLNTLDVHVAVYNTATPFEEPIVEVEHTTANTITIKANPALPAGMRVVVLA